MAKYAIYDGKSNVITPIGEELTAEQWLNRYPWGKKVKMVVGGGVINGTVAFVFDDFVARFEEAGVDFSECETDEDKLAAIEAFEKAQRTTSSTSITTDERIANALEDLVVLNMPDIEEEE